MGEFSEVVDVGTVSDVEYFEERAGFVSEIRGFGGDVGCLEERGMFVCDIGGSRGGFGLLNFVGLRSSIIGDGSSVAFR